MRTDASIFVFAVGAFAGLALLFVSTAASMSAIALGAAVALVLVSDRRRSR
jgi:hypothetical protein